MQTILFGQSIETLACGFLQSKGFLLVEKNFQCRLGEVDLIMLDRTANALVFVEVRYRANAFFGNPTESVDWKKQRKLKRTVLHYLQKRGDAKQVARIDVVGVSRLPETKPDAVVEETGLEHIDGVSLHRVGQYQLVWTRNAISD